MRTRARVRVRAIFAGLRLRVEDTRHSTRSTSTPERVIDSTSMPRGKKKISFHGRTGLYLRYVPPFRGKKEDEALFPCGLENTCAI